MYSWRVNQCLPMDGLYHVSIPNDLNPDRKPCDWAAIVGTLRPLHKKLLPLVPTNAWLSNKVCFRIQPCRL